MTTLEELDSRLRILEDIHAITQLKHRYFRLLDHQDWDELRECFTEDVSTHYENGHYTFDGIDEVMRFLSESLSGLRAAGRWGLHLGHHPEIELVSATEARGRWTLHAVSFDRKGERAGRQESFYADEYRKLDGEWRIRRTGYTGYITGSWHAGDLSTVVGDEADSRDLNASARDSAS